MTPEGAHVEDPWFPVRNILGSDTAHFHRQETPCDHFWMLGLHWQVAIWGRVWLSDHSRGILQIYLFLFLVRTREVRNFVSHWFLNFFPQTKSGNHQFLGIPVSIYIYIDRWVMVWNLLHIIYVYIGIQHCQFLRFESTLAIPHPRRQRDIGRSVAEENSCLFANNCETVRSSGWRCDRRLKVTAFYGRYWLGFSWAKMAGTSLIHFQSFFSDSVGSSVRENSHWFFWGGVWYSYYENFWDFPHLFHLKPQIGAGVTKCPPLVALRIVWPRSFGSFASPAFTFGEKGRP